LSENRDNKKSKLTLIEILNTSARDYFFLNKHLSPDDFEYKGVHVGYHASKEKECYFGGKDDLNGNFDEVDHHARESFLKKVNELYSDCQVVLNFNPGLFVSTLIAEGLKSAEYAPKRCIKYELFYSMSGLALVPKNK